MDLKKRLANLDRMTRRPAATPPTRTRPTEGTSAAVLAVSALGLKADATPLGVVYTRDLTESIPEPQGSLPDLRGFFSQPGGEPFTARDILFLDTETTGLMGGTGTMAFLVGASWWQEGVFHTRQYFLCGPSGEGAMLAELHRLGDRFRAVATYNGASFDLPLLRTRALLNRLDQPWDQLQGWDLLVPCRRIWGRHLENCRQQTVESRICGLQRGQRDIEGHLIPQTWFDFLQQGRHEDLQRVFYHNQRDMAGMGHLFGEIVSMAGHLANPEGSTAVSWGSAWALGRIAERRRERTLSISWLERACRTAEETCPAAFADIRFVTDALRILKRGGDWPLVENVIAWALDSLQNEWWLHREAAILYEHRLEDLARARTHALAAGDEHRLLRLRRKIGMSRKDTP